MRIGDLEIEVIRENGSAFGEVKHQGQTFIVAEPGETFQIRVRLYSSTPPGTGYPKSRRYEFDAILKLDGKSVGHSKFLRVKSNQGVKGERPTASNDSPPYEALFDGFITGPGVVKPFKFAAVTLEEEERLMQRPSSDPDSANKVGTISVETRIKFEDGVKATASTYHSGPSANAKCAQGKGKKGLLAPSLSTAAGEGRADPSAKFQNMRYTEIPGTRKGPMAITYQTENILLLRKILDPTNPEHFALTSYARMPDLFSPAEGGAKAETGPPGKRAKTNAGSQENEDPQVPVDLTI